MSRQEDRRTVSIGRDIKNDIVIDNSSISRNHAIITLVGDEYRLQDNNSLNGVFVNGRKVEFEVITPRDRITIGTEHTLDWSRIEKAFRVKGKAADPGRLSGPSISIGRDPGNDIVIDDPIVSRKHARIYQNENTGGATRYYIEDLDSRNGLFMNGEKITSCQISPQDRITLGNRCQLNWQDVQSAFSRKFSPPVPPPPPPLPQPLPGPMPAQKKSGNAGLWVAGVAVLLFFFLALVLMFGRQGRNTPQPQQAKRVALSHTYSLKRGEPDDIGMRRARIEAQRDLMEKTREYFPNNNSFVENYTIFPVTIESQTKDEGQNAIVTSLYTEMNEPDFAAKDMYLDQNEDIKARLADDQTRLDQDHELMVESENNLETAYDMWNGGTDNNYDPAEPSSDWENFDPEQTYQEAKSIYEEQISSYFQDLESVNDIKTEVAAVRAEPQAEESPGLFAGFLGKVKSFIPSVPGLDGPLEVYLKWRGSDNPIDYYETSHGSRELIAQWTPDLDNQTASEITAYAKNQLDQAGLELETLDKSDYAVEYVGSNIAKISLNQSGQEKMKGRFSQPNMEKIGKSTSEMLQQMYPDEDFQDFNPFADRDKLNRDIEEEFGMTFDEMVNQGAANEVYFMIKEGGKWKRYLCAGDTEYEKIQYWKDKYSL